MKNFLILIFLLLSISAKAQTAIERVNALRQKDVRFLMHKCGYAQSNSKIFMRHIQLSQIDCMESKVAEVKAEFDAGALAKSKRVTEIQLIKAAINLIDSSGKPPWEKKLLKRLVLELRK